MSKSMVSITVDNEIIEYHRAKGLNISKTVNDYLHSLMGEAVDKTDLNSKIDGLRADLAKAQLEKKQYEAVLKAKAEDSNKEELKEAVLQLADLNKRRSGDRLAGASYGKLMGETCKRFGLHRAALLAMVEGRKAI